MCTVPVDLLGLQNWQKTTSQLQEIALYIHGLWTSEKVPNLNRDILISSVLKLDLEKLRINIKK